MKTLFTSLLIVILALLMLVSAGLALAPHLGLTVGNIASGSMEPTLDIGALVVAEKVVPDQLATGDMIVFHPTAGAGTQVCHRILAVVYTPSLAFITGGDNNPAPDTFMVPARNVSGRVFFSVPAMGHVATFLQTGAGLLLGLITPAVIIIVICLRSMWKEIVKVRKK